MSSCYPKGDADNLKCPLWVDDYTVENLDMEKEKLKFQGIVVWCRLFFRGNLFTRILILTHKEELK